MKTIRQVWFKKNSHSNHFREGTSNKFYFDQNWLILILFGVFMVFANSVSAQQGAVSQFADLNTGPNRITRGSAQFPSVIFFDNKTFLTIQTQELGVELWVTDGTPQNTRLFADICPGQCSSSPSSFYIEGNNLFFSADDGRIGAELWRLAAGASGPVLVADINPGASGSTPIGFKSLSFRINATTVTRTFFSAARTQDGRELWRLTNGVAPTVSLERDIAVGPASSSPVDIVTLNTLQVGLVARGLNQGRNLQVLNYTSTTGTPSSVTHIAALSGSPTRDISVMRTLGPNTFLILRDTSTAQNELWVTQGTELSTINLRTAPTITSLTLNSTLFRAFFAIGSNLAVSDGTLAGTVNLTTNNLTPSNLVSAGNRMLFIAATPANGRELFSSDGTAAGTVLLKELVSGAAGISGTIKSAEAKLSTHAFFGFSDQLWISNGTSAGTIEISGNAPSAGFVFQNVFPTRNLEAILGFFPDTGDNSSEPFFTQGTAISTVSLGNLRSDVGDSFARPIDSINNRLIFGADLSGQSSSVSFSLTLTGSPTIEELPIPPFRGGGTHFGKLWFSGNNLIQTDATASGTNIITTVGPPSIESKDCVIERNGLRYFIARNPLESNDTELYRSDGSDVGTVAVSNQSDASRRGIDEDCFTGGRLISKVGSDIFFIGGAASTGFELQKLDINGQTSLVADIRAGAEFSFIRDMVALDDRLVFAANDGIFGNELWVSAGTAQTTQRISDITPGAGDTVFDRFTRVGNQVFFIASESATGKELYVTDGTATGTRLVVDLFAGVGDSFGVDGPQLEKSIDGKLIFRALSSTDPTCVLFETDGSASGTRCIYNSAVHQFGPMTSSRFVITTSGAVVFAATKSGSNDGEEIRAVFNRQVLNLSNADIAPGTLHSAPNNLLAVGDSVFFQANDGSSGREMWRLTLADLNLIFGNGFE